jgi:hypothetical protein
MVGRRKVFLERVLLAILRREFLSDRRLVIHWADRAKRMKARAELLHGDIKKHIEESVNDRAVNLTLKQYRDQHSQVMQQVDQTLAGVANGPNLLKCNSANAAEIHQQFKAAVSEIVGRLEAWLRLIADDDLVAGGDPERLSRLAEQQLFSEDVKSSIVEAFDEAQKELIEVLEQCDGLSDDESKDPVELCLRARWAFYVFLARLLVAPTQLLVELESVVDLHKRVKIKFESLRDDPAVVARIGDTMLDLCIDSTEGRLKMLTAGSLESLVEETTQVFVNGQKHFQHGR